MSISSLFSGMPSLTGGAGGAAGATAGTANNGLSIPISNPFNFDNSGFVVNFGSQGAVTNSPAAANTTSQTATPTNTSTASGASGSTGGASTGGVSGQGTAGVNASKPASSSMLPLLLAGAGVYFMLGKKL